GRVAPGVRPWRGNRTTLIEDGMQHRTLALRSDQNLVKVIATVLILTATSVLAGCARNATGVAASPTEAPAGQRPVGVITPTVSDVSRTIAQPAGLQGIEEATLYAKASGYLKSVAVDKGDRVQAGQVLAIVESPELHDQERQARAAYEQSLAAAQGTVAAKGRAQADVAQAAAAVERARADALQAGEAVAKAQADVARTQAQLPKLQALAQEADDGVQQAAEQAGQAQAD